MAIGLVSSGVFNAVSGAEWWNPGSAVAFCIATLLTAFAGRWQRPGTRTRTAKSPATSAAGSDRESGEVKWFNTRKAFGFIIRQNGEEIFVHQRQLAGSLRGLKQGQQVTFVIMDSDKGLQAGDVQPVAGPGGNADGRKRRRSASA